jgi:two-component system, sensor histidine kinase and response regulator
MEIEKNKNFKILVVDDNQKNLQVIGSALKEKKYALGFAFDGKQALKSLQQAHDYDLVLLDIDMPEMNGYETCRAIRKDEQLKDVPIIFLTAHAEIENKLMGFNLGAQDYITKPFHAWELLVRVKTQLLLKQKSDQVKEYTIELEKLNATKDKFFSIIAHDLRNPFTGLLMTSQALLRNIRKLDINELEDYIKEFYITAKRGNELLENLLEWSKSQRGKITFIPIDLKLKAITDECIGLISHQANAKKITMLNEVPDNLVLKTDENLVKTVIRNLLTNAVKFTFENGSIKIRSLMQKSFAEISVIDNELGISQELQDKLFRIDGSTISRQGTKNETGTGLGLIVCKEFIDKIGGKIWVESEEGKGSTFKFTIPIAETGNRLSVNRRQQQETAAEGS